MEDAFNVWSQAHAYHYNYRNVTRAQKFPANHHLVRYFGGAGIFVGILTGVFSYLMTLANSPLVTLACVLFSSVGTIVLCCIVIEYRNDVAEAKKILALYEEFRSDYSALVEYLFTERQVSIDTIRFAEVKTRYHDVVREGYKTFAEYLPDRYHKKKF